MKVTDDGWRCPWCNKVASVPAALSTICDSRVCECGALGLGAPPWDIDEIVDDAINIFGIADGYMTPFDADRVAGLQAVGVDVVEGERIQASGRNQPELRVLWFRRK